MSARDDAPLGLVRDMPIADYHALPALGSSSIKKLARSPAHFYGLCMDSNRPAEQPSPSMLAGTLAHCALLEPDKLFERYVVKPHGHDGRTKEGKTWAASISAGVTIISEDQLVTATRQADAVRALPEIGRLMKRGEAEVSAFWTDEASGVDCKCRPDFVAEVGEGVILLDLKTCQSAAPEEFPKSIARFGYHLQAAVYSDGFEQASGKRVLGFVFAAVEADYPHAAAAYMLDDESMAKGRADCRRLLQLYAECRAANKWPGYPDTIQPLSLPSWVL